MLRWIPSGVLALALVLGGSTLTAEAGTGKGSTAISKADKGGKKKGGKKTKKKGRR